jgi:hypothetical protein
MSDDFVVNVKQIAQYPAATSVAATDVLLMQGGLGGDYMSILATDLVGNGLSGGGTLQLASTGSLAFNGAALTFASQAFTFSAGIAAPSLNATGTITAQTVLINGIAAADQDWVNNLIANVVTNSVTSFNGRTGAVQLEIPDVLRAGGAPILSPNFGGIVTAPTPWDFRQSDDTVATTAWVQLVLTQLVCGGSLVTSFNGRGGAVTLTTADVNAAFLALPPTDGSAYVYPQSVSPPFGDAGNRIATTLFVDETVTDLQNQLPALIDAELTGANFAPLNSPNFSGVPTAPTATAGSSTGQLATTAFVHNAVVASTTGVASFNTRTGAVNLTTADVTGAGGAPIASPVLTGNPTAPTPVTGNSSASIATTAFVMNELATLPPAPVTSFNTRTGAVVLNTADITGAGGAPAASPALTGVPTAPTAAQADSSTTLATTAFVHAAITALGTTVQSFNGRTGAVNLIGNDISAAGGALLAGPAFTAVPTAPTATAGTSTTQLATCAFVQNAITAIAAGVSSFNTRTGAVTLTLADVTGTGGAPLASPNFSGAPTAPTPAQTSNDTTVATTSFVKAALAAGGVSSWNSRTGAVTLQANDISAVGGALLAGPAFTGVPTSPTPTAGTNTTQIATTAFVTAALASAGGVTSFNSRAGVVTLSTADITGAGGLTVLPRHLSGLALANNTTSPLTVVNIATGSACSDDDTTMIVLPNAITKNCNAAFAAGSGNGGLDAGTALAINTWYYVFAIKNTTTVVTDILISTSLASPALPSGFSKKRRIGCFPTNASAQILPFIQNGDNIVMINPVEGYNNAGLALGQTLASANTPAGLRVTANIAIYLAAPIGVFLTFGAGDAPSPVNSPIGNISIVQSTGGAGGAVATEIWVQTNQNAQFSVAPNVAIASGFYTVLKGWLDPRGK